MDHERLDGMDIVIAGPQDAAELADLLWSHASAGERNTQPQAAFTADAVNWLTLHSSTHVPFIARPRPAQTVGMAWLALIARPPRPGATTRHSADIQSVYVLPEHRGRGIGSAPFRAAVQYASQQCTSRVTVSSGTGAVPLYERLGFHSSPQLLERTPQW